MVVGLFGLLGAGFLVRSFADTPLINVEAESGTIAGAASKIQPSSGASGDAAVRFGTTTSTATPTLTATTLFAGRQNIWDLAFVPNGDIVFTERNGKLSVYTGGQVKTVTTISDVKVLGEGGLLGMTLDPDFATNRYIYTCYNSNSAKDIRLVRWTLPADYSALNGQQPIVTGITANTSGRHSGCRPRFGSDGNIWIGTGDAAVPGTLSQSKTSLNGKVLRVDRSGNGVPGNNGGGFDARVYSYGHRNVQGIAFFPSAKNGVLGISVEHGSDVDDEVNELRTGNFGWAPDPGGYNEDGVPMTDTDRFPDAISAIWSSGDPTQAPSCAVILSGPQWKGWDGAIAMGVMKAKHLKILRLDATNKVTKEEKLYQDTYGRIRTPVLGPDGNLYITTDNGTDDKIIKLSPQ